MAMKPNLNMNLTGVPSVMSDLGLAGKNMNQLSEQEALAKKKKILAAGTSGDLQTAAQMLFGPRMGQTGSQGV